MSAARIGLAGICRKGYDPRGGPTASRPLRNDRYSQIGIAREEDVPAPGILPGTHIPESGHSGITREQTGPGPPRDGIPLRKRSETKCADRLGKRAEGEIGDRMPRDISAD